MSRFAKVSPMSGQKTPLSSTRDTKKLAKSNTNNKADDSLHSIEDDHNMSNQPAVRNTLGFIEKYDRVEIQELLSEMNCHWLLSLEDYKVSIEHPIGLISQMMPLNEDNIFVLMPYDPDVPSFDYREIHQIVRELTIGLYVCNSHPSLQLEANFDESTSCQMPPAYIDTKLGQLMINTDYWLKALWHGAFFPRDKREKFSADSRWKQILEIDGAGVPQTKKSVFLEFVNAGLTDLAKDPEYGSIFADETQDENDSSGSNAFGISMASDLHKVTGNESGLTEEQKKEQAQFFANYVDDVALQMTFGLKSLKQYKNLYQVESEYNIGCVCRADNERIDNFKFEKIKPLLNTHEKFLRENFEKKAEIRKNLSLLKFVSFLVPLLIGLKKRMKIPEMNNLLPLMMGDEVHTERELPPLMLGPEYATKRFNDILNTSKYFNLHGGVQFEIETCPVEHVKDDDLQKSYSKISSIASSVIKNYLEADQQLQDYKVPVIEMNNKKFWCVKIEFESFYAQSPQKPYWVNKLTEDLSRLKSKRLPMTDIQIYDLCKKYFGSKKATKYKAPPAGLRASAQRGCMNIFQSYTRRTQTSRLSKHDEYGLGLMHYAAIFNRPLIVSSLVLLTIDCNIKQQIDYVAHGPLPLHYAARCGSLDTLSCLISNFANITFTDHEGWAPIHHACYFDNVHAIKLFVRKQPELLEITTRSSSRKTPILIAALSGSLEAVKCCIELGANLSFHDEEGYNLIHLAAQKNHTNIIDFFINNEFPQLPTWALLINMLKCEKDEDKEASVKCLQMLTYGDKRFWPSIKQAGGIDKLFSILRAFSVSITPAPSQPSHQPIGGAQQPNVNLMSKIEPVHALEGGGQPKILVRPELRPRGTKKTATILNSKETISLNAILVLCNLSDQYEVRVALSEINDLSLVLSKLLIYSENEDMQSRVCILISDVASANEKYRGIFVEQGCLEKLLSLLNSDAEDLLVNAVNSIEILCKNNIKNQNYCCENGVLESFTSLLELNSDLLKSAVAAAISAIVFNNYANQTIALRNGIIRPLGLLLKSRNMTVQLKVSSALEALAVNNQAAQEAILEYDAANFMIRLMEDHTSALAAYEYATPKGAKEITIYLDYDNSIEYNRFVTLDIGEYLKYEIKSNMEDWSIIVREQAAQTLWTLAGTHKPQQKSIAEKLGIPQIISMLMSKSESLQYVGCKSLIALVTEDIVYQNQVLKENGIDTLIRLLKSPKTSDRVIMAIVETIGALCVDIAHVNNKNTQDELIEKGAIEFLVKILHHPPNKYIQIETIHAISCLILNRPNDQSLNERLDIGLLVNQVKTDDLELRLKAGLAITVYAYNNTDKQYEIKKHGGISYESYKYYIEHSNDPMQLCKACFQIVVLARIINDRDQVWLTALGISKLCELLLFKGSDQVVIQTASYLSSLAHTRAGITDAMITCDAVDILCDLLYSPNDQIKFVSAVTLGFLTFNRTASRLLLHNCRNVTHLFDTLMSIMRPETKISQQFIESYQTALQLGLPKLLVKNKVKFYETVKTANLEDNQRRSVGNHENLIDEENDTNVDFQGFYNRKNSTFAQDQNKSKFTSKAARAQSAPMLKNSKNNNIERSKNSNKPSVRPITVNFKR